jgi:hypothetical protein
MGLHYPTDQLLSAAIGNFVGLFVHDAFILNPNLDLDLRVSQTSFHTGLTVHFK